MSSNVWKWLPLKELFNYGNRKRSHAVRSGEYGAYSRGGNCYVSKNWWILWNHYGTHILMFKFVVKINLALSLSILNSSAIILMPKRRSVLTRVLTFSTLPSFSSLPGGQVVRYLPRSLFVLQTSCAVQTHEFSIRCLLHMARVTNWTFQSQFSSVSK
jgi:hypothetical protein